MANEIPQIGYTPFPSDWIDPKLKQEKAYNIQYAKAAYYLWQSDACLIPSTRRTDYITNRKYAEGNQDNTKYKRPWTFSQIEGNEKKQYSYADLDYSIVSVIPKYRDIVLGYLEKLDYEPTLAAIDPLSDTQRRGTRYGLWAKKKLNDMMVEAQILTQMGEEDEQLPQTQEELEIYMQNFKLATEIAMAGILNLDFDVNKWPETAKKVREDLFDNGIAGTREYTTKGGRHVIRYVDIVNLFVRKTRSNECLGSNAIGEVIEMTIADLYADAGDQFSLDEYKAIAEKYAIRPSQVNDIYSGYIDTDSDQYQANLFLQQWGDSKIRVFDLTWFTVDDEYYEERVNGQGEKRTVPAKFGYSPVNYDYIQDGEMFYKKNKKTQKQEEITKDVFYKNRNKTQKKANKSSCKMVYGCKWIVGSDNENNPGYVYDYGMTTDIPRPPENLKETNLPYHIYRYSNKSIVERMMPLADSYMLAWLKIQNAMSRARPKGIIVEITALENMSIGGKEFSPLQSLAVFDATGNLIYKGTGAQGDPTRHRPVEETQGGMGAEWQELIGYLNKVEEMIQRVSGFNDVFAAISPDPKQSVAGSKLAVNQSYNAIQSMLSGFNNIYLRTAKSSALRFQIMSHYKQLQGYEAAIGEGARKIIEYGEDMSMIQLGIKMEMKPSAEQKAKIEAAALQAMNTRDAQGISQITYSDYLFVMRCLEGGNLKYADSVLAYRINKRIEQQQLITQENSKMNAQIQTESTKVAEEEARKTLEFKTTQEIKLIDAKANADIRVNDHKLSKTKETEIVKADAKIQQTESTNDTKKNLKVLEIATTPEEKVVAQ